MASININDYIVEFPYPNPYDIQRLYMEKVIHCLHNKVHGVLESPTGTGKTLCLLAPVAAWVRKQKLLNKSVPNSQSSDLFDFESLPLESQEIKKWGFKSKSVVWYTSRTHSQIAQTVAEIRRCNVKGLNIRVMGARDQLCINSEVLNEQNSYIKTIKCKELIKGKSCKYYLKLNHDRDFGKYYKEGEVMDIEDLVSIGKLCGVCPYYLSKAGIETADIVLLPYNYIIDKDSRDANGVQFKGDVIIFDEGHNVPTTCEESYEFSFTSVDIALGIKNIKELMISLDRISEFVGEDEEVNIAKHAENAIFLVEVLTKLENGLDDLEISNELLPVSVLYKFFNDAGIHPRTVSQLLRGIEEFKSDSTRLSLSGSTLSTFHLLEKMMNIILGSTVTSFDEETINRSFKCSVRIDPERGKNSKLVCLYCFNPSFGIRAILQLGIQSIIITSGTLSPIRTFIHELNLPKPITLQNGHIAKKCQVPFMILGTGVNSVRMDAAFTNRNDEKYIISLGMTLTNLISSVPDGVLLLFSSYSMMKNLKDAWEVNLGIWNRLNSLKRVFIEPRGKEEFINCMENYKRAIDSGNGAILMGVLRGKVAEGMDFKDQYCRAVFIIGVPFPPAKDLRVKGKERYSDSLKIIDSATGIEQKLYNISYMSVEAMRATNQAIGRVIRHGNDYGAIVLVDYRFAWARLFQNISAWLRGDSAFEKNFPQAKKMLGEFFKNIHFGKLGIEEIRRQRVDGNGCPLAGYINYEEYEHKKAIRKPAPWIAANVPEERSGTSVIKYLDDDIDVLSLYKSSKADETPSISQNKENNSIFQALESTKNIFPVFGEMRPRNIEGNSETSKRKLRDAQEADVLKSSLPTVEEYVTENSARNDETPFKKISRTKIHPFLKCESTLAQNTLQPNTSSQKIHDESVLSLNTNDCDKKEESYSEDALKVKLVNYFKSVKRVLKEEDEQLLKKSSFRYMKSELTLSEMIVILDRLFDSRHNEFYRGFGICVKSRDREEWKQACNTKT